jgi:hypothetical protein
VKCDGHNTIKQMTLSWAWKKMDRFTV